MDVITDRIHPSLFPDDDPPMVKRFVCVSVNDVKCKVDSLDYAMALMKRPQRRLAILGDSIKSTKTSILLFWGAAFY